MKRRRPSAYRPSDSAPRKPTTDEAIGRSLIGSGHSAAASNAAMRSRRRILDPIAFEKPTAARASEPEPWTLQLAPLLPKASAAACRG
jgi:hypothetical protein